MLSALHRDRTLILALRRRSGPHAGTTLLLANAHLSAGHNADRRLRQTEEALSQAAKEAKNLGLDLEKCPVVYCGDLNSQGSTAVRELLVAGEVRPDFRESGDPTEKGQNGVQITSKIKRQAFGAFQDAAELCFGTGSAPATILVANIDSKMMCDDNTLTPAMLETLRAAFKTCCKSGRDVMTREEVVSFLLSVNKELGRGSEYRSVVTAMEKRGQDFESPDATLTEDDFIELYAQELEEGKFWGVEHDLRALCGQGMALPSEGPTELCFDHMFFTPASLRLVGVQETLTEEQRQRIWGPPFDVLPNAWHPSDHLPVAAAFALR